MFKNGQLLLLAVLSSTYTSRIFSQLVNFENGQRDAADPATLTKSIAAASGPICGPESSLGLCAHDGPGVG